MDENPQSDLNFATEQNKTPVLPVPYFSIFKIIRAQAVPYFSISNRLKPQSYLILAFSMEENPASPYFTFLSNITTQSYLSCTLF